MSVRTGGDVRVFAVTGAVLLLATATFLANRVLPGWAYPVCGTVTAVLLVVLARSSGVPSPAMGLGRHQLGRGAVVGLIGMGLVLLTFAVALAVPALRPLFDDGRVGSPDLTEVLWQTLIRIPLGTVLVEEVAFRGVLPALLGGGQRWRWGPVLGAAALFGLWHLLPSLALVQNAAVAGTFGGLPLWVVSVLAMLAAAGAGVFLHWWRHTGRSLLAPMAVHTATNCGGLAAAWWLLANR
ncbi:CPBP family intramembrane glutamic endopeptidase [Amycolatopsis sp. YIM 10]|uniref:CPBP family intramembrane glutamic endopeptidase n=1 Tax=Amycolatopsis sp. YIM 10 TaxID=2653857 RepID=UPI0012902B52|nr:CPBP family intramembrane glutamic endopeptidase [Amycolatopsis sp. YIM 10]QFU89246.1 CAAX amino terminal protease self- immunity [Amycolatopsis sp. YIM 10]